MSEKVVYIMINTVYIGDESVELVGDVILERNRKESADYGKITVLSYREKRYEPNTVVDINDEQYIIQSDEPLLLKNGLYEHQINLGETILRFSKVFPVDRSFTTIPAKSIREILDVYKIELSYYQNIKIDYVDNDLFSTKIPNKEYTGSFAEILYDLFRSIDAIPRVYYDKNTTTWMITHELYTQRRNEITISSEGEQSTVNDVDYATEVLSKSINTVDEEEWIWYPDKNKFVTPRSEGTMFQTSALRYELDSPIMAINQAVSEVTIDEGTYGVDYPNDIPVGDRFLLKIPAGGYKYNVDITGNLVTEEEFNSVKSIGNDADPDVYSYFGTGDRKLVKENTVSYKIGDKYINNLYSSISGFLGFTNNIFHLRTAVNCNAIYSLKQNGWDYIIDNYLYDMIDGHPSSEADKEEFKKMTAEEIYAMIVSRGMFNSFFSTEDTENIKLRLQYRPRRDIAFITEKYYSANMNKTTISNNQRDSFVDIGRYIENNNALAQRIGNEIKNVTETFYTWEDRWRVGDYVDKWLIIDVRYQVTKTCIVCTADFAEGFSNTEREYSISRTPSAYLYTGKTVQSNFILRNYLELYNSDEDKIDSGLFKPLSKRACLNIFNFNDTLNKPLLHANVFSANREYIDAVVRPIGRGNVMLWHFGFDEPLVAGYGMEKQSAGGVGTYAWFKNPILYVDKDTFELKEFNFALSPDVTLKDDTATKKYYPNCLVSGSNYFTRTYHPVDKDVNASLSFTTELIVYSNNDDIIIGGAFTKYNNLIKEFDTEPELELYRGISPYTVFDKYPRDTDTNIVGSVMLEDFAPYTLTVLDSLDQSIQYWCLAYNGEIVIAGNNYISEIKFNFRGEREYNKYVYQVVNYVYDNPIVLNAFIEESIDVVQEISVIYNEAITLDIEITQNVQKVNFIRTIVQPRIELESEITASIQSVEFIDVVVQPTIILDSEISQQLLQVELIRNTISPTILIDSTIYQVQGILEKYLDETSTQTPDYTVVDYGFIEAYRNGGDIIPVVENDLGPINDLTIGDIIKYDKGDIEQITGPVSVAFTLTVSSGDANNYSAILSAMSNQRPSYYNDIVDGTVSVEDLFRVDDGFGYTYYKILLVSNRTVYYEIKSRII